MKMIQKKKAIGMEVRYKKEWAGPGYAQFVFVITDLDYMDNNWRPVIIQRKHGKYRNPKRAAWASLEPHTKKGKGN